MDFSSFAVDVVILDDHPDCLHPVRHHRFELHGQDALDRARNVRETELHGEWWRGQQVAAAGIEDPRGQNAGAMYRVQGAILATIPKNVLVQPWIPSQWRKAVGLPGNASKTEVRLHAEKTLGYLPGSDAADAYCIALATRARVR